MTLQEAVLLRLLPRYDRLAEDEPPFAMATAEQALHHVRERLRRHDASSPGDHVNTTH